MRPQQGRHKYKKCKRATPTIVSTRRPAEGRASAAARARIPAASGCKAGEAGILAGSRYEVQTTMPAAALAAVTKTEESVESESAGSREGAPVAIYGPEAASGKPSPRLAMCCRWN